MNEIKELIELLKEFNQLMLETDWGGVPVTKGAFRKALSHATQILEAYDQAGEELPKKSTVDYGDTSIMSGDPTVEFNVGFNQAIDKATAVVAKKNGRIAELEKSEYQIRANYGDLLSDFRQSEKEFQSLKSSIIEKLKKAKYPVFTIKTSEQLNKKIDIIIKELKGTNERTN